jgi:hypothetical protein
MSFLRGLQGFVGMFQGLLGMFMSGQMIFFPVVHSSGTVRVGREFMELRRSLMRVIGHSDFRPCMPRHAKTIPFLKLSKKGHSRAHPGGIPCAYNVLDSLSGRGAPVDGPRTRQLALASPK